MSDRNEAKAGAKLSPEAPPVGKARAAEAKVSERYSQLLGTLALADRALETGDGARRGESLAEASGIVFDLLYSLDFRCGGETVPRLAAIYGYIGNELLSVGRTGDRQHLAQLRDMVATLRNSWQDGQGAA
jgi:flagellin-specific chaperone FliS